MARNEIYDMLVFKVGGDEVSRDEFGEFYREVTKMPRFEFVGFNNPSDFVEQHLNRLERKIMEQEKDYSLLRPFNLEAAKRGDPICDMAGKTDWQFIHGLDRDGCMILMHIKNGHYITGTKHGEMRMAPLDWLEGKPVYVGDMLWNKPLKAFALILTADNWNHPEQWSWEKPAESAPTLRDISAGTLRDALNRVSHECGSEVTRRILQAFNHALIANITGVERGHMFDVCQIVLDAVAAREEGLKKLVNEVFE